jgi:hypothetical protein
LFGIKDNEIDALGDRARKLFDDFLHKPTENPSRIPILSDHIITDGQPFSPKTFQLDVDYFEVVVNELFLAYQSRLWVKNDPTVLVNTQFGYGDKKDVSVPFLVGPSALKLPAQVPKGGKMVFKDTTVAGLYPFKGGQLQCSVVLCQLNTEDLAKKIMNLVEAIASALDYSTQLSAYLKVAGVVLDGIEELAGIKDGLTPVVGYAAPFSKSGYFALINLPNVDKNELWVVDNQLKRGKDPTSAQAFTNSDYVLYSINATTTRDDWKFLPFYASFEKIIDDASRTDEDSWKRAKTDMSTLYMTMYKSPDLTHQQALQLYNDWIAEMTRIHEMNNPTPPKPPIQLTNEEKKLLKESFKALAL